MVAGLVQLCVAPAITATDPEVKPGLEGRWTASAADAHAVSAKGSSCGRRLLLGRDEPPRMSAI